MGENQSNLSFYLFILFFFWGGGRGQGACYRGQSILKKYNFFSFSFTGQLIINNYLIINKQQIINMRERNMKRKTKRVSVNRI